MPARVPFVNRLFGSSLLLAAALLLCAGNLPPAAGQADVPASDQAANGKADGNKPASDKAANRSAKKKAATKSGPAEQGAAEKKGPAKKDPEKKGTAKKSTEKKSTEKKVAKAKREQPAKPAGGSGSPVAAPYKRSEAEREEAALALVREHHPALVELLERLKATKQADYQQAIKELYRDSQRLATVRERDQDRYALELRAWQLDSRIRLLTAKLSLEDRVELEEELKACLAERGEVRLSLKKLERDRVAARAKKLDEEIEKLTTGQEADVNRAFERLLRAAQRAAGSRESGSREPGSSGQGVKRGADGATADAAGGRSQADQPQTPAAKGEPSAR